MIGVDGLDDLQQAVVRDHEQRVDLGRELLDALLGLLGALLALEAERPRDDADGQRAELACELRDHGRGARAGAAALARGHEHHVRALERLLELVAALDRGLAATSGFAPAPRPRVTFCADGDLDVGVRHQERLRVGVDGDELDAAQSAVDHAVDGVGATAADPDNFDDREIRPAGLLHRHRFTLSRKHSDGGAAARATSPFLTIQERLIGHRRAHHAPF